MKASLSTLLQAVVLVLVSCAVGLGVNQVRGSKNHVDLSRDYFRKPEVRRPDPPKVPDEDVDLPADGDISTSNADQQDSGDVKIVNEEPTLFDQGHIDPGHGLQVMTYQEALEMFEDDGYALGTCIFVDARNDGLYQEGHIPGAFQLDHYRSDEYLPRLLPIAKSAERVVIYCEGGDCEDSLFAANDLLEADVDYEVIFLFEGGMSEWLKNDGPITEGEYP
jgi:rhodanese-related sulfurtransferase